MRSPAPLPLVAIIAAGIDEGRRIRAALGDHYRVLAFTGLKAAVCAFAVRTPHVIIIDDLLLRATKGDVMRMVRGEPALSDVPLILVAAGEVRRVLERRRELGTVAIVDKPIQADALLRAVSRAVNSDIETRWQALPAAPRAALQQTSILFGRLSAMIQTGEPVEYNALKSACLALIDAIDGESLQHLLDGVRQHDDYTYGHSLKVSAMLAMFGRRIGLPGEQVMVLAAGGLVHDVGKIRVPIAVLNKAGRLSPEEWLVMKGHVKASARCLETQAQYPRPVVTIAAQHHEKLDGSGYPLGLSGSRLNELTRMASIIDIFSALTDRRVYRPGIPAEKALSQMQQEMQSQLDMRLFEVFRQIVLDEGLTF